MEKTGVQKLAKVLKVLVIITFVCNLIVLLLVPVAVRYIPVYNSDNLLIGGLNYWATLASGDAVGFRLLSIALAWVGLFSWPGSLFFGTHWFLAAFLVVSGICTAIVLWQAKRVLSNILKEYVFCQENAANMKRAAVCCFVISGAALIRLVGETICFASARPLFTYNTLFIPIFFMGGLVLLVMSALLRQAAEIKEENDKTI